MYDNNAVNAELDSLKKAISMSRKYACYERCALDPRVMESVDPKVFVTPKSLLNEWDKERRDFYIPDYPISKISKTHTHQKYSGSYEKLRIQLITIHPIYNHLGESSIMINGRTDDDKTIALVVSGFNHYCYMRCPGMSREKVETYFMSHVNSILQKSVKSSGSCTSYGCMCTARKFNLGPQHGSFRVCKTALIRGMASMRAVKNVSIVKGRSMIGYEPGESDLYKIEFSTECLVTEFKKWWFKNNHADAFEGWELFEADTKYVNRFMIDANIRGSAVFQVDMTNATTIGPEFRLESTADIVARVQLDALEDTNEDVILPIRIISFDIETTTCPDGTRHSDPSIDPVIQISVHASKTDGAIWTTDRAVVFTIGDTNDIAGGDALDRFGIQGTTESYEREEQMILAFWQYMRKYQPDVLCGYNSEKFDLTYLTKRCEKLGLDFFTYFGRSNVIPSVSYTFSFSSAQKGKLEMADSHTIGIVHYDLCVTLMKGGQLDDYSLDAVSKLYIKDKNGPAGKEDIKYHEIPRYQQTRDGRTKLASYCLLDSILVTRIIATRYFIPEYISTSRTMLLDLPTIFQRGVSFQLAQYSRFFCNQRGVFLPSFAKERVMGQDAPVIPLYKKYNHPVTWDYQGATVLEPSVGLHANKFIAVLDFKSLYPAEIQYYNMSGDSYIINRDHMRDVGLTEDDVYCIPVRDDNGNLLREHFFVKEHIHVGMMSMAEKVLGDQRSAIKKKMKQHKEKSPMWSVYNSQQLGVKLIMNSYYGIVASMHSAIPVKAIAESITAAGRAHLQDVKRWLAERYPCDTIYGDTDSVFVHFRDCETMQDCFKRGEEVEGIINDIEKGGLFDKNKAMYLEMEKVFENLLLVTKKCYAGIKHAWDPKIKDYSSGMSSSGIKTVRRDTSNFVRDCTMAFLENSVAKLDHEATLGKVRGIIGSLMDGTIDIDDLAISTKLKKWDMDNPAPQIEVAKKMKSRGIDVGLGMRIKWYVTEGAKNASTSSRAECVEYGKEHKIPGSSSYYMEKVESSFSSLITCAFSNDVKMYARMSRLFDRNTYDHKTVTRGPLGTVTMRRKRVIDHEKAAEKDIRTKSMRQTTLG